MQLCPQAIVVAPRISLYSEISREVMAYLAEQGSALEQVSIDEAFVDLSERIHTVGEAKQLGKLIQAEIFKRTELTMSIGIAPNKLLAKIASGRVKPRGLTVVPPGKEAAFLAPLDIADIWGVGKVAEQKLRSRGIHRIKDAQEASWELLASALGDGALTFRERCLGRDQRPVSGERRRLSVGSERTHMIDLQGSKALKAALRDNLEEVVAVLKKRRWLARSFGIKIRYAPMSREFGTKRHSADSTNSERDLRSITRTTTTRIATQLFDEIWELLLPLIDSIDTAKAVRLSGVFSAHLVGEDEAQLALFDDSGAIAKNEKKRKNLRESLRERFGEGVVYFGDEFPERATPPAPGEELD